MTCKAQQSLRELVDACQPVYCQMLHHKEADRHGDDEDCTVVTRYEKALENARDALSRGVACDRFQQCGYTDSKGDK